MTTKPDGGPAYPGTCDCDAHKLFVAKDGMSLRDWFAGQAIRSLGTLSFLDDGPADQKRTRKLAARYAYSIADAMIAERGKR